MIAWRRVYLAPGHEISRSVVCRTCCAEAQYNSRQVVLPYPLVPMAAGLEQPPNVELSYLRLAEKSVEQSTPQACW